MDNVLAGDRSTVEQVEIVFGAGDQLYDLTSYTRHVGRDTTGQLLSKGVLMDKARSYMKGLITIEKSRGRDRQLPRRVRDEPLEVGPVRGDPVARDRPAGLPAGGARSSVGPIDETQLFYLESRGIAARRGPQVHRARVPRAGRRSRSARDARERLRDALEAKWAAGLATAPPPLPDDRVPAPERRVSRRIDLLGADELAEGEMRMVWVDQTDPSSSST